MPFAATLGFSAGFQTRHFDVSPNDQRLLTLRIEGGVDDELILVENWAEELRERGDAGSTGQQGGKEPPGLRPKHPFACPSTQRVRC